MELRELEELLSDIESDRVERKASIADRDRIAEAICSYANDLPNHCLPGYVFVGANDDGTCANLPITETLLTTLADMCRNGNIYPFPVMNVQKHTVRECEVAIVEVFPSGDPPVRFRGRTWIRIGPRRAIATAEEERRLIEKRRAGIRPFDLHSIPSTDLGDLDQFRFQQEYLPLAVSGEILGENVRSVPEQLASLRFTTKDGVPTVLGVLVVGKDPREFLPGAYIQFLRIDGDNLDDPIKDQKEIDGLLLDVLRRVDEVLQINISTAVDVMGTATDIRRPDYPVDALRQLVRNAILHRTYEGTAAPVRINWFNDRIEIHSPGGPFGQVTRDNFGAPGVTDYRNPHLAEAMKVLGYVQRFGVGIPIARQELEKNGNPELEYIVEDAHILAIVRKTQ